MTLIPPSLLNCTLYGNPFDHIIVNFLNMKDIYNLRFVNKRFFGKIDENYILRIIKSRLECKLKSVFGNDYNLFVLAMSQSKAVLSGSFILQCILGETWENSDIDIYVGNEQSNNIMDKFLKSITNNAETDDNALYKAAYEIINNITNYHLDNLKIQVVQIRTNNKYSLWNHVNNTGFDVCKNRLYYSANGNLQLQLTNYKEAIHKCTTFIIQNIDDFYYRIEKYSKRGFKFKPKYHKLMYVEWLFIKFSDVHVIKTNFNEDVFYKLLENNKQKGCGQCDMSEYGLCKHDKLGCGVNCPIKLLYRNVRHYHTIHYIDKRSDYGDYSQRIKCTVVDNKDYTFSDILPQLSNENVDRTNLGKAMRDCKDMDDYVKIRNKFTRRPLNVNYTTNYKYDIQFGLPCIVLKPTRYINMISHVEPIKREVKKKVKNEPDKNGWILVGPKK